MQVPLNKKKQNHKPVLVFFFKLDKNICVLPNGSSINNNNIYIQCIIQGFFWLLQEHEV